MIIEEKIACQVRKWIVSDISAIEQISGGRNSQTYKITSTDGQAYSLKVYFQHMSDLRDRMGTEYRSLSFLWEHGIRNIPRPIAADKSNSCALYQYVNGIKPRQEQLSVNDIIAANEFLKQLRQLGQKIRSEDFSPASEACFALSELFVNLEARRQRLEESSGSGSNLKLLKEFLQKHYDPSFMVLREHAHRLDWFYNELPFSQRTLSPSDFGFHNAIRRIDGTLVFLDFEYFGWDDPAKTLCDFLLHPAMHLDRELETKFLLGFLHCFVEDDPKFVERVCLCYRLYALKWCLILLNEFLPEHWERRTFAGQSDEMKTQIQLEQLMKAKKMIVHTTGRRNWLDTMLGVTRKIYPA